MQASKSSDTTIRQARDIIARWSSSDLLDQISALPPLPPLPKPHFPRLTDPVDSFRSELPTSVDLEFGDDGDTDTSFADPESVDDATGFGRAPYSFAEVARPLVDPEQQSASHESLPDKLTAELPTEDDAAFQQDSAAELKPDSAADDADNTPLADDAHSKADVPESTGTAAARKVAVVALPTAAAKPRPRLTDMLQPFFKRRAKPEPKNSDNSPDAAVFDAVPLGQPLASSNDAHAESKIQPQQPPAAEQPSTEVVAEAANASSLSTPNNHSTTTSSTDTARLAKHTHRSTVALDTAATATATATAAAALVPSIVAEQRDQALNKDKVARPAAPTEPASTQPVLAAQTPLQTETPAASDPAVRRRPLPRAEQPRHARERTPLSRPPRKSVSSSHNKTSAAALNEGQNPVTRKFRVDRPGGEDIQPEQVVPTNVAGARIQSNSSSSGRRYRIDDGEPPEATLDTADRRVRTQHRPRQRYIDDAHESAVRGPHFQVTAPKRSNLTSMTGQFLAYLGVLGLTIGTAIVIYGHFGGYSDYTPTGWLVTTVAQMMLFLGVINLVSGGIEQTNDDVSARINTLGEQLLRIEQVTEQALRGPKISAQRYAQPDAEVAEHESNLVPTRERQ